MGCEILEQGTQEAVKRGPRQVHKGEEDRFSTAEQKGLEKDRGLDRQGGLEKPDGIRPRGEGFF